MTIDCCHHQGCRAILIPRMDVGPFVQQCLNGLAVAIKCR